MPLWQTMTQPATGRHGRVSLVPEQRRAAKWHAIALPRDSPLHRQPAQLFVTCYSLDAEFRIYSGDEPRSSTTLATPTPIGGRRLEMRKRGNPMGSPFLPLGLSQMNANIDAFIRLARHIMGDDPCCRHQPQLQVRRVCLLPS